MRCSLQAEGQTLFSDHMYILCRQGQGERNAHLRNLRQERLLGTRTLAHSAPLLTDLTVARLRSRQSNRWIARWPLSILPCRRRQRITCWYLAYLSYRSGFNKPL